MSIIMSNISELLVNTLKMAGVKRIYGIVGDSLNSITNVIAQEKEIQFIHTRHEEVAAFAAGAESQLTGELTVCAGSCGPGNLHLINGLYDCHRSRTPVLAIASHIPSFEIGNGYFQETHPEYLFKECSFYCELLSNVEQFPRLLKIAMHTAISQRGVAVIVIPGDIASETITNKIKANWTPVASPIIIPPTEQIKALAKKLNQAKKVTLFCGIGAKDAHDEVIKLCTKLKAPVVHTLRAKESIEPNNPFDVGMTGLLGINSGYQAIEKCDTLLLLGTSFPYRQFYPSACEIIQIDINGGQLAKKTDISMGLIGDVKLTLQNVLPLIEEKKDDSHLKNIQKIFQESQKSLNAFAVSTPDNQPLHPQFLIQSISDIADAQAIFTCDVGTPTLWCARYLKMNGQRKLLGSFNHGSMANALAQAIGAQASHPKAPVIAICGDGGLSMLLGDILTLNQHHLPVKVIVLNNGQLNFVEMEMHASGMMEHGTSLCATNFANIANAAGICSYRVESASKLNDVLQKALSHPGPALIDVVTRPDELAIPPTITVKEIAGFGLYMVKAIINDRGDEVLHLTKDFIKNFTAGQKKPT